MALALALEKEAFTDPERDFADRMYRKVQDVIKATCVRFWQRHGGDLEELESQAQYAWFQGHKHHMECLGHPNYATEIRRWVWFELFDKHRTRTGHRRAVKELRVGSDSLAFVAAPDMVDTLADVSEDAKFVLRLVLRTPAHLAEAAQRRGGEPRNLRNVVRSYLSDCMGWTAKDIARTFEEIKQAL